MSDWKIKRGNEEFTAPDADTLRLWAADGRVVQADYVFNPVLQRWMYASELAELETVFRAKRMSASANSGCLVSLVLGLLAVVLYTVGWHAVAIMAGVCSNLAFFASIIFLLLKPAVARPRMSAPMAPAAVEAFEATPAPSHDEPTAASGRSAGRTALYILATLAVLTLAVWVGLRFAYASDENKESVEDLTKPSAQAAAPSAPPIATPASVTPWQSTDSAPTTTNLDKIDDRANEPQAAAQLQKANVARRQIPIDEIPRGSLAAQVYLDATSMTYYREDCAKPTAAERRKMPKAMAIKAGYRPAPDCYATK